MRPVPFQASFGVFGKGVSRNICLKGDCVGVEFGMEWKFPF